MKGVGATQQKQFHPCFHHRQGKTRNGVGELSHGSPFPLPTNISPADARAAFLELPCQPGMYPSPEHDLHLIPVELEVEQANLTWAEDYGLIPTANLLPPCFLSSHPLLAPG